MLLASLKATSQTVDTSITFCTAAKISEIYYMHSLPVKTDTLTHIGFYTYSDDTKGNCIVNWIAIANNKPVKGDSYKLSSEEYNRWDGSAVGLIAIIGAYLKITFK